MRTDTGTGFLIDSKAHEYKPYKVVKFTPIAQVEAYLKKNPQSAVDIESTTVDTGERKIFFGDPAKHFITTTKRSPDKSNAGGEETVDAWYIDHELPDNSCALEYVVQNLTMSPGTAPVMPPQVARLHHTGPIPMGLAVRRTGTNGAPDRTITIIETIEEFSDSPVSLSSFESPSAIRENPHLFGLKLADH